MILYGRPSVGAPELKGRGRARRRPYNLETTVSGACELNGHRT